MEMKQIKHQYIKYDLIQGMSMIDLSCIYVTIIFTLAVITVWLVERAEFFYHLTRLYTTNDKYIKHLIPYQLAVLINSSSIPSLLTNEKRYAASEFSHFAPVLTDPFQLNPRTLQNAIDKQKEVLVALQSVAVIVTTDRKSFNKSISKSQSFNRKSQMGWKFPAVYIGDGVYPGVANISGIWYGQVGQDKTIVEN